VQGLKKESCPNIVGAVFKIGRAPGMKKFMIVMTLVLAVSAPQLALAGSDLSLKDKEYIRLMKKKHLWPDNLKEKDVTPEQLNEIRKMIQEMEARHKAAREPGTRKPVPDNHAVQLDALLRSKWNAMRKALAEGDIDRAASYFCDSTRDRYREIFRTVPAKDRRKLAQALGDIQFIREMGNLAEYDLRATRNGKEYSHLVLFEKTMDGEWRIRSF
jgi:hypothetical protein